MAQVGAVRREIVMSLGTQSNEVNRVCQGDFCKWTHGFGLLGEIKNGEGIEGDVSAW